MDIRILILEFIWNLFFVICDFHDQLSVVGYQFDLSLSPIDRFGHLNFEFGIYLEFVFCDLEFPPRSLAAGTIRSTASVEQGEKTLTDGPPSVGVDAIADGGPFDIAFDEAGGFQFAEVLTDGGLGEGQFVDQVATHAGVDLDEVFEDGDAGRVGHGLGQVGQVILLVGERFGLGQSHDQFIVSLQYYDE